MAAAPKLVLPPGWTRIASGKTAEGGESKVYWVENQTTGQKGVIKVPTSGDLDSAILSNLVSQDVAKHKLKGLESKILNTVTDFPLLLVHVASGEQLNDFEQVSDLKWTLPHFAAALDALHSIGWAHNDLNGANILVDTSHKTVTIIDYGRCAPNEELHSDAGNWDTLLLKQSPSALFKKAAKETTGLVNDWLMYLSWSSVIGKKTVIRRAYEWFVTSYQSQKNSTVHEFEKGWSREKNISGGASMKAFCLTAYFCVALLTDEVDVSELLNDSFGTLKGLKLFDVPPHPSGEFELDYLEPLAEGQFDVQPTSTAQQPLPFTVKGNASTKNVINLGQLVKKRSYKPVGKYAGEKDTGGPRYSNYFLEEGIPLQAKIATARQILGIRKEEKLSTGLVIRQYRKTTTIMHPDRKLNDAYPYTPTNADAAGQEVREAYEFLKEYLESGTPSGAPTTYTTATQAAAAAPPTEPPSPPKKQAWQPVQWAQFTNTVRLQKASTLLGYSFTDLAASPDEVVGLYKQLCRSYVEHFTANTRQLYLNDMYMALRVVAAAIFNLNGAKITIPPQKFDVSNMNSPPPSPVGSPQRTPPASAEETRAGLKAYRSTKWPANLTDSLMHAAKVLGTTWPSLLADKSKKQTLSEDYTEFCRVNVGLYTPATQQKFLLDCFHAVRILGSALGVAVPSIPYRPPEPKQKTPTPPKPSGFVPAPENLAATTAAGVAKEQKVKTPPSPNKRNAAHMRHHFENKRAAKERGQRRREKATENYRVGGTHAVVDSAKVRKAATTSAAFASGAVWVQAATAPPRFGSVLAKPNTPQRLASKVKGHVKDVKVQKQHKAEAKREKVLTPPAPKTRRQSGRKTPTHPDMVKLWRHNYKLARSGAEKAFWKRLLTKSGNKP